MYHQDWSGDTHKHGGVLYEWRLIFHVESASLRGTVIRREQVTDSDFNSYFTSLILKQNSFRIRPTVLFSYFNKAFYRENTEKNGKSNLLHIWKEEHEVSPHFPGRLSCQIYSLSRLYYQGTHPPRLKEEKKVSTTLQEIRNIPSLPLFGMKDGERRKGGMTMLKMNGRKSPGLGTHMERNQWRWESSSLEEEDRVFSKWLLYFNCVCDILGVYSRGIVNSLVTQSGRIASEVEP